MRGWSVRPFAWQLACAFVLVDASLGVTAEDDAFLSVLDRLGVQYHAVSVAPPNPRQRTRARAVMWDDVG